MLSYSTRCGTPSNHSKAWVWQRSSVWIDWSVHHGAPRFAHGPAAPDPVAGQSAAEKIPEIGRHERRPEAQGALFHAESFAGQVDGKPLRHHEPVGIEERAAHDNAPGLAEAEKVRNGEAARGRGGDFWRTRALDQI